MQHLAYSRGHRLLRILLRCTDLAIETHQCLLTPSVYDEVCGHPRTLVRLRQSLVVTVEVRVERQMCRHPSRSHLSRELLRDDSRRHTGAEITDVVGEALYQPRRRTTARHSARRNVRQLVRQYDASTERRQLSPVARVDRDPIAHGVRRPGTVLHLSTRDSSDLAQVSGVVDDLCQLVL